MLTALYVQKVKFDDDVACRYKKRKVCAGLSLCTVLSNPISSLVMSLTTIAGSTNVCTDQTFVLSSSFSTYSKTV